MSRTDVSSAWRGITMDRLGMEQIRLLAEGAVPFVRVPAFLDPTWCDTVAYRFWESTPKLYERVDLGAARVAQLGCAAASMFENLDAYFALSKEKRPLLREIYHGGEDPFLKVRSMLAGATGWPVVAAEEEGKAYATDVLWALLPGASAPLHSASSRYSDDLFISRFDGQLSWDAFFSSPEKGGELSVYRRAATLEDDEFRLDDGHEMHRSVVAGCEHAQIRPEKGDLIFFNPDHYHHALAPIGQTPRLSAHSFIGLSFERKESTFWA